jgi:hypothetical protein
MIGKADADLGVAVEGPAFLAAKSSEKAAEYVSCDHVVDVFGPSHRIHRAADVFMLHWRSQLTGEVSLWRDEMMAGCG